MATYSETILATPGIQSYWRLNESAGVVATDALGVADGTYLNAPTLQQTGAIHNDSNKAVLFNGSSQNISGFSSSVYKFIGTSAFTVEFWYKFSSYPADGYVALNEGSSRGWFINWNNTIKQFVFGRFSGGTQDAIESTANPSLNVWHHIVCAYDGVTIRLYEDGIFKSSLASSRSLADYTGDFTIGSYVDDAQVFFGGYLDEIAVYNTAISSSSVAEHYNYGINKLSLEVVKVRESVSLTTTRDPYATEILDTSGLVSYWRLGDVVDSGAAKDSAGVNDGTYSSGGNVLASSPVSTINGSVDFNGSSGYVSVPDDNTLDMSEEMSIECWFYPRANAASDNSNIILAKGDLGSSTDQSYGLIWLGSVGVENAVQFRIGDNSDILGVNSTNYRLPVNKWSHIVGTYKKSTQKIRIYINGILSNESSLNMTIKNTVHALSFGARTVPSVGGHTNCLMDEIALYNVELTPQQISTHFNYGSNKFLNETIKISESVSVMLTTPPSQNRNQIIKLKESFSRSVVMERFFADAVKIKEMFNVANIEVITRTADPDGVKLTETFTLVRNSKLFGEFIKIKDIFGRVVNWSQSNIDNIKLKELFSILGAPPVLGKESFDLVKLKEFVTLKATGAVKPKEKIKLSENTIISQIVKDEFWGQFIAAKSSYNEFDTAWEISSSDHNEFIGKFNVRSVDNIAEFVGKFTVQKADKSRFVLSEDIVVGYYSPCLIGSVIIEHPIVIDFNSVILTNSNLTWTVKVNSKNSAKSSLNRVNVRIANGSDKSNKLLGAYDLRESMYVLNSSRYTAGTFNRIKVTKTVFSDEENTFSDSFNNLLPGKYQLVVEAVQECTGITYIATYPFTVGWFNNSVSMSANLVSGSSPLKIDFVSNRTDGSVEKTSKIIWEFEPGIRAQFGDSSIGRNPSYTYKKPGLYNPMVTYVMENGVEITETLDKDFIEV